MCTVIVLRRKGHSWPILLAANRDEMAGRPWRPPARHWPDRAEAVGGLDEVSGGSWLGVNDHGVAALVLNREGTLGPAVGKRTRGELVLEALDHADAATAAEALADINPMAYRPFNLVIVDDRDAFCLYHRCRLGREPVVVTPVPEGLSMITAFDRDDVADPRIRGGRPRFLAAAVPEPDLGDWAAWQEVLASREPNCSADAPSALCFSTPSGFGTMSSALIALPSRSVASRRNVVWLFADGPPDQAEWRPVDLG